MRRRILWLVVATALVGLAAWLWWPGGQIAAEAKPVVSPEKLLPHEDKRAEARRSLHALPVRLAELLGPPQQRDPLLAALRPSKSAMVFEASALTHSPAGELLVKCFLATHGANYDQARQRLGFDPLKDLDRIAVEPSGPVFTGQLGGANWSTMFSGPGENYGEQGVIYPVNKADGHPDLTVARWGDQLLAFGDPGTGQQTIDQIEGRGPSVAPPFDESQTYGDVYGVIGSEWLNDILKAILPATSKDAQARLLSATSSVEVHLDATSDLNLAATFRGIDPSANEDLGRALGVALSAWRLSAEATNSVSRALLERANIIQGDDSFRLEVSMPLAMAREQLDKNCVKWMQAFTGPH
jgi:hypothetical protein